MKHILGLVFAFFALSFTESGEVSAHVEKTYFLKGKIAERDIAIKMLCYDESPLRQIHYFFQNSKKDQLLTGNFKNNSWHFTPEVQMGKADEKLQSLLDINEGRNGVWKGTWTDSTGKTYVIVLNPLMPDSVYSKFSYLSFIRELDVYENYRLSSINFTKTKTEKPTKNLLCNWLLEKESGISFFRLQSTNNNLKTDSINAALEAINLSLIQKYFSFNSEKVESKVEPVLHYLSDELISFEILSTITLKAHKTLKTREAFTLDLKTGEPANLEDIIWFDREASKPPMDDLFKIYKYRKNFFAPKVFHLLQQLYPNKMKTDSCNINKVDTWILPTWNLTNNGIVLSVNTTVDCGVKDWAIIPYERFEPFLEEKYHLKKKK